MKAAGKHPLMLLLWLCLSEAASVGSGLFTAAVMRLLPHCMLLTGAVNLSHHHQTAHLKALIPQAPEG
jgi:hypothetical protein